ncbi:alpha/beta fold hydrolase [Petrocella sp. FN5]|uniref:alpha/beta fold hydrolase n=1 Tax=Petrocella sp. FN5 TaxID=3032002 RepID=UPI0023DB7344|nr:alpha/beta fold hydrolase [Petrocella sp. FN5]MDF1617358.1 alpha/beta fold hydrolase [Petrocella sp. FN5]
MDYETVVMEGYNESPILIRKWTPKGKMKGCLHILHGMAEHCLRYDDFAKYLCKQGFVVWAHDHRQHGYSIGHHEAGFFDRTDSWDAIVEDVGIVQRAYNKLYVNQPMFMLGHSMGSLILRSYLQSHQTQLSGAIVMGSPITSKLLAKLGIILSRFSEYIKPNQPNHFLNYLSVGVHNKTVNNPKTPFDWICSNPETVTSYSEDPLCGYNYTPSFYETLSRGTLEANNTMLMRGFPKIKTLFISGEADSAGKMGEGIKKLSETYRNLGIDHELILMPGMRHEILNEVNRNETYEKILDWLNQALVSTT